MIILFCNLRLFSELSLEEVGQIVTTRVLGGIRLEGKDDCIRDEVPTIYTKAKFLGMWAVLMGKPDEEGYYLTMDTREILTSMSVEEIKTSLVDISPLVARLLEGTDQIRVGESESN